MRSTPPQRSRKFAVFLAWMAALLCLLLALAIITVFVVLWRE